MPPIRVLLAGTRVAIIESLSKVIAMQPDMTLVDTVSSPHHIGAALRGRDIDIVIVEQLEGEPMLATTELLHESPRLRVLSISTTGPELTLHMLRPHEVAMGNMSLPALLRTIRGEQWVTGTRDDLRVDGGGRDVRDR